MKKILLGLGTLTTAIVPIAAAVSCNNGDIISIVSSASGLKEYFKNQDIKLTDEQAENGFDAFKFDGSIQITKRSLYNNKTKESKIFYFIKGTPTEDTNLKFLLGDELTGAQNEAWDIVKQAKQENASIGISTDDLKNSSFVVTTEPENGTLKAGYEKVVTNGTDYGLGVNSATIIN